jgi:hypothetical protein
MGFNFEASAKKNRKTLQKRRVFLGDILFIIMGGDIVKLLS